MVVVPIGNNDCEFFIVRVGLWSQRVDHEGRAKAIDVLPLIMPMNPVGARLEVGRYVVGQRLSWRYGATCDKRQISYVRE